MRTHRGRKRYLFRTPLFWKAQQKISAFRNQTPMKDTRAATPITTWRTILARNTDEFCRNTTIHGLKYINSRKLLATDRIFFGLAFLAVLCIAGFLIHDSFEKWNTTPVIVGLNPEPTYITDEPFPAVTICNLNQALAARVKHFTSDTTEYAMLQSLCHRNSDVSDNVNNHQNIAKENNWEEFILNVSQPCGEMIIGCRFGAEDYNCARVFYPIVTDEGLCCVFNMLHPRFMYKKIVPLSLRNIWSPNTYKAINWHAELGFGSIRRRTKLFYPRAASGTGESLGLSLILDVQANDYYCSSSNSIGFKIALHSPNESPNVRETGVLLAPGLETKLRIDPSMIMTEKYLRAVDRKYRRCLFHNEGNQRLRYFAHYTQRNCNMECLSRSLLKHCGCIGFYMPRINGNDTICSIYKSKCVDSVRLHTIEDIAESCVDDCLPSCFDLTFNSITFSAKITNDGFENTNPTVANYTHSYVERSIAVVNMYYKDETFRAKKQTEFIGISDFLSNVGGLMGLFLGFSFLSIAECVYFALIRPCRSCSELHRNRPVSTLELIKLKKVEFVEDMQRAKENEVVQWFHSEYCQYYQHRFDNPV
ncbi:pickpocket protein 28 [Drosophila tropicalis]|uniref:pickpocket protein 28 n=1 Tax=Drosophila tropicalis TaxID=46794 RepID=UPI0035ABA283